jgi:hypothetical protein
MWGKLDTLHSTRARSACLPLLNRNRMFKNSQILTTELRTRIRGPSSSYPMIFPPLGSMRWFLYFLEAGTFRVSERSYVSQRWNLGRWHWEIKKSDWGGGLFELKFATFLMRLLSLMRGSWAEQKTGVLYWWDGGDQEGSMECCWLGVRLVFSALFGILQERSPLGLESTCWVVLWSGILLVSISGLNSSWSEDPLIWSPPGLESLILESFWSGVSFVCSPNQKFWSGAQ